MQSGAAGRMGSGNCARDSVDEFGCGLDDGRKEKPISNDAGLRWGHLPRHRHRSESHRVRLGKDDEDREARCEEIHGCATNTGYLVSAASKNGGLSCDVERRSCRPD